ncbi:ABC transporter substrate-binding protein [Salinibacterium sp. NG253]|uniref:ABC transporter substrate-binding protein n=1 Tax=Salinibacterium sp. NG253 TaxID=2792039 RepID=UPI0018CE6B65|nr:ABC transporter substrate-binding protein [Salinibacterium sp. NG253]MBH0116690.1 ABC transporter substrate-binding protein [Salinibacterium sp. NG253]
MSRTGTQLTAIPAMALAAVFALTSCSAPADTTPTGPTSFELTAQTPAPSGDIDSFTWVSYAEPYSLDYAYAFDYADNQVLSNVCDSLLRLNPDFTISPSLASAYSNPTPVTWVYELRSDVTFHDGSPLTADDAVASMLRHLNPDVGSSWYSIYQNVAAIEATGPLEVTVTLASPDSQFNYGMSGAAGVIESAATLNELERDYGNSTGLVNCSGPFELTSWKSGESVTLTRYDDYWDQDLRAKAAEVEILFMNDPNARVNALTSGQVDGGWLIPTEAYSSLQSSSGDLYFGLNTTVSSLIVSDLTGPLGDVNVRKALMMALDRQGIVDAAQNGYGTVTNALTTESVWGEASADTAAEAFSGLDDYPYDVEAAKQLIEDAGVAGEEIVIRTAPIGAEFSIVAQATAAAAQSIGLEATIDTVTPEAYSTLFFDPSAREGADLFFTAWYLSTPDPLEMFAVLQTGQFPNYGNYSNSEYDSLVNEGVAAADPEERATYSAQLQKIANQELPWMPLYEAPISVYLGERVTGVAPSIAMLYFPWAATIGAR